MELLTGTVEISQQPIQVHCALGVFHRGAVIHWRGYFITPKGILIDPAEHGPHRLKLTDGRAGEIRIVKVRTDRNRMSMVDFEGIGPLQVAD